MYKKQNDPKGRYTFRKIQTNLKLKSKDPKRQFLKFFELSTKNMFFRSCDLIFYLFAIFSDMSIIPGLLSFIKFCVARFFSRNKNEKIGWLVNKCLRY